MRVATVALIVAAAVAVGFTQEKGGDDRTGPYDVVDGWPQPLGFAKAGYIWGSTGACSPNRPIESSSPTAAS